MRYQSLDAFLSANCFVKQCRKNRRRAEFCCVRNFNQACCDYLGSGYNNVSIVIDRKITMLLKMDRLEKILLLTE